MLADLNVLGTGSRCPLHEKWAPDVCPVNREYSRVMIADMHAHKCNDLDIIYSLPANDTLSTYKHIRKLETEAQARVHVCVCH